MPSLNMGQRRKTLLLLPMGWRQAVVRFIKRMDVADAYYCGMGKSSG